jgi:hypothetical protein
VAGLLSGTVSCLAVRGNVATFNVPGTRFGLMTFEVIDNVGSGALDAIKADFSPSRSPADCTPLAAPVIGMVAFADIVVVDAQPFPTSKDQCKHGGWRGFGDTFKNQGQCVAFVQ